MVEIVHCVEEAVPLIDQLMEPASGRNHSVNRASPSGEGVGGRGSPTRHPVPPLWHPRWAARQANCIIPTAQNLANLEADMLALVPAYLDHGPAAIEQTLEMLVRAYDPCISCAVHRLEVKNV